jgi:hypothetical protein
MPGFSAEDLRMLHVSTVDAIDVFKGADAAIFGLSGGNGAISITTIRPSSEYYPTDTKFNSISFKPLGYQQPVEFYAPKYDTPELKFLTSPDYRTTLFWKPDLILSDDGKASFNFYTSDFPTTYSVVIEGMTNDGKIIRQVEKIEVK